MTAQAAPLEFVEAVLVSLVLKCAVAYWRRAFEGVPDRHVCLTRELGSKNCVDDNLRTSAKRLGASWGIRAGQPKATLRRRGRKWGLTCGGARSG